MKTIFDERQRIIFQEQGVAYECGELQVQLRTLGNDLERDSVSFTAHCIAKYDKDTGALHIKLDSALYRDWAPAERELVELHRTRERALRRVIEVADDWYGEVACAVPALLDPAELLASQAAADAIPY